MFVRFFNALGGPLIRFVQYLGEVVFLAAEDSAWITGESLLVAGGLR